MADLNLNGRTKVKTLKAEFKKNWNATLRVYNGVKFADDDATLASIRQGDAKGGELKVSGNIKVGNFEDKMKEIFDLIETSIPKTELIKWSDNTEGSLRNRNLYSERRTFLEQYLSIALPMEATIDLFGNEIEQPLSLKDKNIVVLDDQLTTAATAWHIIKQLKITKNYLKLEKVKLYTNI